MKWLGLVCAPVGLALPAGVRADVGNRSPLDIEVDALSAAIARDDCGEGLGEARNASEAPGATWGIWAFRLGAAVKAKPLEDEPAAAGGPVRARPDVHAAIAAVGHTERIPLCQRAYVDSF